VNSHQIPWNVNPLRPILRSLLQKTVRRGYADLSKEVAFILASRGDSTWLRARTGVIVFEECWPCANLLGNSTPSAMTLSEVAAVVKNKDAAGLGSLAHAAAEGDSSAIEQSHDPIAVKIVAAALKRPASFFKWATETCINEEQLAVVQAAQRFFGQASWPWDKAFMAAGAYLSCQVGIPQVMRSVGLPNAPFPYWTAIDKHTPQGKVALRKVALDLRIPERQLQWISFYFESARTNASETSQWWECEAQWRFESLGLSMGSAEEIWGKASICVERAVQSQTDLLLQLIDGADTNLLQPSGGLSGFN
jgi:hypothetical protein